MVGEIRELNLVFVSKMASIRIHEDQENRVPEIRQKQATMAVQQKRPVLGLIENDKQRTNVPNKGKQVTLIIDDNISV